jgi:DSF synthase
MDKEFLNLLRDKPEISMRYDPKMEAIWIYGNPQNCPCLSASFLKQYHDVQLGLIEYFKHSNMSPKTPVKFLVYASQYPDVYSYGGDLEAIIEVIKSRKRKNVEQCAQFAIKNMYLNAMNLNLPIQTITLVEGVAMGGGFEGALPFNAIIAEEQSTFGLQQMRFNMLPGSGIYSFLARKVGMQKADEIITDSKIYSANDLYDMGIVTKVAQQSNGVQETNKYMKDYRRSFNAMQAFHKARLYYHPFEFSELEYMAELWVGTIMDIDLPNLKMLQKIADGQKQQRLATVQPLRAKQDRRFMQTEQFPFSDVDGNIIEKDRRNNPDPREKN